MSRYARKPTRLKRSDGRGFEGTEVTGFPRFNENTSLDMARRLVERRLDFEAQHGPVRVLMKEGKPGPDAKPEEKPGVQEPRP